jgi:hypothetical protein
MPFINTVQKYCKWAEASPGSVEMEVFTALELLSELYFYGLKLDVAEDWDYPDFTMLTHDDWVRMHKRFGSMSFQCYRSVFDPLNLEGNESGIGDVCDDLADIYRDLKNGLILYETIGEDAGLKYWQGHFSIHWGRHLTDALNALECYRSKNYYESL